MKALRFIAVGLFNTAVDFGILFALTAAGMHMVPANMIATGVAMCVSFALNRKFVFRSGEAGVHAQIIKFFAVTLIGLWVLQPIVLYFCTELLAGMLSFQPRLFVAKVLATGVSMVWNFLLYDKFVFKQQR